MDLSQKYVYAVWRNQSFSKAAKALYVSQPSLSATVAKLENELGFKIFNRSTHPISTTVKGRIYLNFLEEVHEAENQLNNQLAATNNTDECNLSVGGRISFAQFAFPAICQQLIKKHPKISLTLDIGGLEEKLHNRLIDLQFTLYPSEKEYTVVPIQKERLLVAIQKDHPDAKPLSSYALSFKEISTGNIPSEREITDPLSLSHLRFIKSGKGSDSDKRLSVILKDHITAPCSIINSGNFDSRYRMAQQGLGAVFLSDFFLKHFLQSNDNLSYFALRSPHSYRTIYIQYQKDSSNQKLLEEFVSATLDYCKAQNSSSVN